MTAYQVAERCFPCCSMLAFVLYACMINSALAGGTNTTAPNSPPATPAAVTPSTTQVNSIPAATCAQQLNNFAAATAQHSQDLAVQGLAAQTAGVATQAVSVAAEALALATEVIIANPAPALGAAADAGGLIAAGVGLGISQAGVANNQTSLDIAVAQSNLPSCDTPFAGTITVTAGGINVTGDSIFQNNLGVVGNVNVGGSVTASNLSITQGVSFLGGGS